MHIDPLQGALGQCSTRALVLLTAKALERVGSGDVELVDRRRTGRNGRRGGFEIVCRGAAGLVPVVMVVKVVRTPLTARTLDEVAGAASRAGADAALVVTPHHSSALPSGAQADYAPLRLLAYGGSGFAELIRRSGIGVRPRGDVDYAFLESLECFARGRGGRERR